MIQDDVLMLPWAIVAEIEGRRALHGLHERSPHAGDGAREGALACARRAEKHGGRVIYQEVQSTASGSLCAHVPLPLPVTTLYPMFQFSIAQYILMSSNGYRCPLRLRLKQ